MKLRPSHIPDPSFTPNWSPYVTGLGVGRSVCGIRKAEVVRDLNEVTCQRCLKKYKAAPRSA